MIIKQLLEIEMALVLTLYPGDGFIAGNIRFTLQEIEGADRFWLARDDGHAFLIRDDRAVEIADRISAYAGYRRTSGSVRVGLVAPRDIQIRRLKAENLVDAPSHQMSPDGSRRIFVDLSKPWPHKVVSNVEGLEVSLYRSRPAELAVTVTRPAPPGELENAIVAAFAAVDRRQEREPSAPRSRKR